MGPGGSYSIEMVDVAVVRSAHSGLRQRALQYLYSRRQGYRLACGIRQWRQQPKSTRMTSRLSRTASASSSDYAYITIHGQPGENGVMQGYFDLIHMPYSTSGVLVEAMTFDKYVLNNYLRGFGVRVADSILLRRGEDYDEEAIAKRIGMPCFVKPAADGSSFGVSKVKES